ncbi:carbohydrate ABC transporter, N-acetylglucosamine/diacetylchitobiose-binding protein [Brachybacterium avium]|uniref:Carbohydrate ABC transporter, N-acetylglucosamine/diacetylchitobiose-binding protein n=1 Tax=Brachybacterium avium TaxID=2017485 RepID=A0A220UB89_9MICO|nr:N-acetylglucosamine/diacetylchitobiose ABC transporter substrate-binding protein [Brachybacterium avium]ASK65182.1 carbohydrate ABC transporter, N-acetylglucosamine/diacetylchitobiose-binding protein [Brachybacterium avium]
MDDSKDPTILDTPAEKLGASRRLFLSLAGAGAGAAALSACAAGGGGSDDEDGGEAGVGTGEGDVSDDNPFGVAGDAPVDVVIFNGGYGDQYAKDAGDKYEEMYPDADVKVSSTVNIQPDLQPRFIGGNPPDLFDNSGAQSMNAGALVGESSVAELDQLAEAPSIDGGTIKDSLIPGSLDAGTYSGKVYAFNYVYTVYAVWLSRKQFEDKGWAMPATWDDVMTIGEAAKAEGIALFPWGGQNASNYYRELALSMAIKEGGIEVQKNLDRLEPDAFEQDSVVAAYAAIEDAVKAGYFLSGGAGIKHTEAQAQWVTGKAVMYPSGSWIENEQKGITPDDYEMVGVPTPQLSSNGAMPAEAIHGTAGEPFFVPSDAANGAGGLEFLRIMLSKEQAQNFSEITSSPTVLKDTIPEDAFGSTALASTNEMITAAGENTFHINHRDWYGLGPDTVTLWTEFLSGGLTADQAREREQAMIDGVREDDSIEKFDVPD